MLNHIANQVLKYLNIDDEINNTENYLSWMPFIYLSVYKHLELEFDIQFDECIVGEKKLNLQQFVNYYISNYKDILDIHKIEDVIW